MDKSQTKPPMPRAIAELPEPARSFAMELFLERRAAGARGMEPVHQAVDLAMQWIAERVPADRSEIRSPDPHLPDREPLDDAPQSSAEMTSRGLGGRSS